MKVRDAEGFLLLDVVDLGNGAHCGRLAVEDRGRRLEDVGVVGKRNRRNEDEGRKPVDHPHEDVNRLQLGVIKARKGKRERIAHEAHVRPLGLLHGKAQCFEHEARGDDEGKAPQNGRKASVALDARVVRDEPPPGGDGQRNERKKPRRIEHRLIKEIEVAREDALIKDQMRNVPVKGRNGRAEEEEHEAPEEHEVRPAQTGAADARLQENLDQGAAGARALVGKNIGVRRASAAHLDGADDAGNTHDDGG